MKSKVKKAIPVLFIIVGAGVIALGLMCWDFPSGQQVSELSIGVSEILQSDEGLWIAHKEAVAEGSGQREHFVLRLKHLRTERLAVEVVGASDGKLLLRSEDFEPADLLVLRPRMVPAGQAVVPTSGLDEERLIRLTLEAGMEAATTKDLDESVRFISPDYQDGWGFTPILMRELLKRAYEEFEGPQIELAEPPVIQIQGSQAMVLAKLWLSATYQGRRNYLLGEQGSPNHVFLWLEKFHDGWKVSKISGLRPLSFGERFFRLLGSLVGLPLTEAEREEQKRTCMPCRVRMAERFGLER